jgi:hypothetical protein
MVVNGLYLIKKRTKIFTSPQRVNLPVRNDDVSAKKFCTEEGFNNFKSYNKASISHTRSYWTGSKWQSTGYQSGVYQISKMECSD